MFILVIEVLPHLLRINKKIKGCKVNEQEILTILFADDLGLILQYDKATWLEATVIFNQFHGLTGLLINYEKSLVYRIGSLRDSNAKFYSARKLIWTDKPFKILGIIMTTNKEDLIKLNIDPLLEKTKAILQ